jgi:hypothetical protein
MLVFPLLDVPLRMMIVPARTLLLTFCTCLPRLPSSAGDRGAARANSLPDPLHDRI